jgi:hypothetical protein
VKVVQQLAQAEGRVKIAQAALNSLGGTDIDLQGVAWPKIESGSTVAIARSFELLEANQRVALVVAKTEVVRSEFDPSFSAGIAADVWSLDRNAFRRDNFGIQVLLSMPLFDSGQKRGALGASRSEVNAAKARVAEAQRIADLKLVEADAAFKTAQLVVTTYEGDVLPKGEALLTAMREGYSSGLVNLVEVLEAQQTLVKLRQERIQAVLTLRLAEVDLWRAQLALPGTEVPR